MKAVVFDMDGVLFDTERLSISCWMETAQKMGLGDISEGAYGCMGRAFPMMNFGRRIPLFFRKSWRGTDFL